MSPPTSWRAALHQLLEHAVEVEIPKRAVEVVGAPDGTPGLHPRVPAHSLPGERPHHRLVGVQQRAVEHLGELLGGQLLHGAAWPALLLLARLHLAPLVAIAFAVDGELRPAQREVHLEDGLERAPVRVVLHERGGERVFERVAILDRDVLDGLHRVEVLGERDGQSRRPQLLDEPAEQIEHRATQP